MNYVRTSQSLENQFTFFVSSQFNKYKKNGGEKSLARWKSEDFKPTIEKMLAKIPKV